MQPITLPLSGSVVLGRGETANIALRDPTVGREAALLWMIPTTTGSPFWLRVPDGADSVRLGDLCVREANLPAGLPLALGETRIVLEREEGTESQPTQPHGLRSWLTCSEEGISTLWLAKKAAATPLSLYLAGETGTGKEVLAQLAHAWSERASGPFVPLHCAALPLALIESEFRSRQRCLHGRLSPASRRPDAGPRGHAFSRRDGDLPMDIQVKLLRFLENGEIRPVGADRLSRSDVRLVCATHKPLLRLVEEGKFRRDLITGWPR